MGDMLIRGVPEALKHDIQQAAQKDGQSLSAKAIELLQGAVVAERNRAAAEPGSNWERIRAIMSPDGVFDDDFAKIMDEVEAEGKRDFGRPVEWPE